MILAWPETSIELPRAVGISAKVSQSAIPAGFPPMAPSGKAAIFDNFMCFPLMVYLVPMYKTKLLYGIPSTPLKWQKYL
jgi:hypothetical protein